MSALTIHLDTLAHTVTPMTGPEMSKWRQGEEVDGTLYLGLVTDVACRWFVYAESDRVFVLCDGDGPIDAQTCTLWTFYGSEAGRNARGWMDYGYRMVEYVARIAADNVDREMRPVS